MDIQKIDKKSRDMLAYLNTNTNLSSSTLADAFNQHYNSKLTEAIDTLSFLQSKLLVEMRTLNSESAIMIHVTHAGSTYEQDLLEQNNESKKKFWHDRCWSLITLFLSALLTILINLIMKWGFGI